VRKDMGRPVGEYRAMVEGLCAAAIGVERAKIFN
jgi:hypothetical protein